MTNAITVWSAETGQKIREIKIPENPFNLIIFSPDSKNVAALDVDIDNQNDEYVLKRLGAVKLWNIDTGGEIQLPQMRPEWLKIDANILKNAFRFNFYKHSYEGVGDVQKITLIDALTRAEAASIVFIGDSDWVVTTPDGRFDTNKSLDKVEGLHWLLPDHPLTPKPLEIFMRQYYEPGLLERVLKCNAEKNCEREFKPLPSVGDINRVQPKVTIKEIRTAMDSADSVDAVVEVENVTEDFKISPTVDAKTKRLSSGVYDLRLFRDGQLVGVSTPQDKLEKLIADAPQLVAEAKAAGKLINTPEDIAWREANDVFKIKSGNVRILSSSKAEYTFHNIRLPRDGRKEVEFTAYAFNSDRVKSENAAASYKLPESITQNPPRKGRAVIVSIGVNASENPAYNLRYASNDAREMQEILGDRLKAESSKYSDVIQIPLISDHGAGNGLAENNAQKAIIKNVFSILAGREPNEVLNEPSQSNKNPALAAALGKIPNIEKLRPIEPEDTLIITYSGHGYADQAGIFYLLPYDIGANTTKLTPETLQRTISSDELSLWMQDITAAEMMIVIDACHSSAAVQGDGFKPGPMGSRGLGQLAYDKGMKILSATQADNVALEIDSLEQGLLSFVLLHDGIISGKADTEPRDRQLTANEWLAYAVKRVPKLYEEVVEGKHAILIGGKSPDARQRADFAGAVEQKTNLQQPSLFDFTRKKDKTPFIKLR